MSAPENSRPAPRAVIFGCSGPVLEAAERRFLAAADPLGFILFGRNCESPGQVRDLVAGLRDAVGRADAPVLIDQEGGRVARLGPPHWRAPPPPLRFAELERRHPRRGVEAARLGARLIAEELAGLGIDVDCAPVLDVAADGADPVIGDRAAGTTAAEAADLGRAFCDGLLDGGVLPAIKHLPGHGRATVDSHRALPRVEAPLAELREVDFAPFRALRDMPWALTAHVVYTAIDGAAPATQSARVVAEAVRGLIGFDGVLVTDDIGMGALGGDLGGRARAALEAGCDVVLHCTGEAAEMEEVTAACRPLDPAALARLARAEALRRPPQPFDPAAGAARLAALMEDR